jgi:hypothetical protein
VNCLDTMTPRRGWHPAEANAPHRTPPEANLEGTDAVPTHATAPVTPRGLLPLIGTLVTGDPHTIRQALAGLAPILREVYDRDEAAWQAGAPADFLAATLYASPRYYLRLHAHAPGAVDGDLHTHKGTVYSTLLSGELTNTTAAPAFTVDARGLDLWRCACLADGSHTQHRTGITALVDPATIDHQRLTAGHRFTVRPGDYHRLSINPDPAEPTVTLCLFEQTNPDAPDAYVLTNRPTPVLTGWTMTAAAARRAVRRLLDRGAA